MCQRTTCRKCGKAGYRGCGQHVEQVLAGVPAARRCTCRTDPTTAAAPGGGAASRFLTLFRRRR